MGFWSSSRWGSHQQKNGLRWRTGQQQGPRPQVGDLHSSWTVWWPASSWPRWGRAASEPRSSRGWAPEPRGPIYPHSSKVSVGGTFPEGQITKPKDKKNAHHAAALALSSRKKNSRQGHMNVLTLTKASENLHNDGTWKIHSSVQKWDAKAASHLMAHFPQV